MSRVFIPIAVAVLLSAVLVTAQQAWDFTVPSQSIGWPQDYPQCQAGQNPTQSPIDFSQVPVDFNLRPLPGDWADTTRFKVSSVDKVSLTIYPTVGIPAIAHPTTRRFYKLKSAQVFSPSMHTFGGAPRDMEISLLHELSDPEQETKNGVGPTASKYLSVSFTFNAAPLKVDNTFVESIFGVLGTLPSGGTFADPVNTTLSRTISWASAVPLSRDYYHYKGSLPTPPCSPDVEHFITTTANRMSYPQLADIRRILGLSTNPSGNAAGFGATDAAVTSSAAFAVDGNMRTVPTPVELRKKIVAQAVAEANPDGGSANTPAPPITRFMDFVGDSILLKERRHTSFIDDIEMVYQAVYGISVVSFVLSLLALRIGIS